MNDQRSPAEKHRRNSIRVRFKGIPRIKTVEDEPGVGEGAGLDRLWNDCSCIGGVGCAQPWENWIIIRAVGRPVCILVPHISSSYIRVDLHTHGKGEDLRQGRVWECIPQLLNKRIRESGTVF